MQRANGDWFALEEKLNFRVPLFASHSEAMRVRAFNVQMLVFKPALIDERALKDTAQIEDGRPVYFWLVDEASTNQKFTGRSSSICAKSLSVRSSISAGLKRSISKLQARTRIASLWLEKSGTRKLNFSSIANQSPLARCIPYMLLIADLVLERDQDRLLRGGGEVMCISSFLS